MIIKYRQYDIIPTLVEVAQNAVKEKVIRVIVATFRVGTTSFLLTFTNVKDIYIA